MAKKKKANTGLKEGQLYRVPKALKTVTENKTRAMNSMEFCPKCQHVFRGKHTVIKHLSDVHGRKRKTKQTPFMKDLRLRRQLTKALTIRSKKK